MSLNVLVSAAVQRTGEFGENGQDDFMKKKRKKTKLDTAAGAASGSSVSYDDEEEKQRKRRAQIAEASRRSRARRKKEFLDFKEENDQLWSQNMMLRKTLEDLGVFVPAPLVPRADRGSSTPGGGNSHANSSEDEDDDGNHSVGPSPAASPNVMSLSTQQGVPQQQQQQQQQQILHGLLMNQGSEVNDTAIPSEPTSSSPSGFSDFCQFFERRLSWYFTQLKSDAIRSFASHLPYDEKQKLASLQVKLALKDGVSPAFTPSTAIASTSSFRQLSATSAEQAVDQDKHVRL